MAQGETYTCAACGGTFAKIWSDDEARAEAAKTFHVEDTSQMEVVCEDCYKEMGFGEEG